MQGPREEWGNGSGSENAREIFLGMDGDDRAYLRYLTVLNTRTKSLREVLCFFIQLLPARYTPPDWTAHHHFTTAANRLLTGR